MVCLKNGINIYYNFALRSGASISSNAHRDLNRLRMIEGDNYKEECSNIPIDPFYYNIMLNFNYSI